MYTLTVDPEIQMKITQLRHLMLVVDEVIYGYKNARVSIKLTRAFYGKEVVTVVIIG